MAFSGFIMASNDNNDDDNDDADADGGIYCKRPVLLIASNIQ